MLIVVSLIVSCAVLSLHQVLSCELRYHYLFVRLPIMKSDVLLQLVRVYLYVRQLLQDFYDSLGDSSSASDSKDHGRVLFWQA